ncbi:MAG: glycoside hydrolase [Bacteroidales bacterium]|nr:glycoside hydrolase [Bacteroidales bacterium]
MKRTLLCLALMLGLLGPVCAQRLVVAYVGAGSDVMPDMRLMTHIDYAFGHVNETFDGIRISRPERLEAIVAAKGDVKVCLSIGGWGSGRFSEMAATEAGRKAFALDCARVIRQYNLDGIDLDWEYPTSSAAGISSSPEDTENFTLLMKEIRSAIGPDMLLTLASAASAKFIDFEAILPVIDWVNVMSYDMGRPPRHNAALRRSPNAGFTMEGALERHLAAGIPKEKIVMGMPFYGHGNRKDYPDYVDYKDQKPPKEGLHEVWDDVAKIPYYADADGRMVLGFDNVRSIRAKCEFILSWGVLGGMYWEYSCDNEALDLSRTVAECLLK